MKFVPFIKFSTLIFAVFLASGCVFFSAERKLPDIDALNIIVNKRFFNGEKNIIFSNAAKDSYREKRRRILPDLAAYFREKPDIANDETSIKILWESAANCIVLFSPEPDKFADKFCSSDLECKAALLIAEKQYLDCIVWKTPDQQTREQEIQSELHNFFPALDSASLSRIKLIHPADDKIIPIPEIKSQAISEDPAALLQIADMLFQLPTEIRRQMLADKNYSPANLMNEVMYTAAYCTIHTSKKHFTNAKNAWMKNPSPENLWSFRKWGYILMRDISRIPAVRGKSEEKNFISSMLLLHQTF